MKTLVVLFLFLLTGFAQAAVQMPSLLATGDRTPAVELAVACGSTDCEAPPREMPNNKAPSFGELRAIWQNGVVPASLAEIQGNWKAVVLSYRPGFYQQHFTNQYNLRGIHNADGSLWYVSFSEISRRGGFPDPSVEKIPVARLHNLGSKNSIQGPYQILFDAQKGACFAQYAYNGGSIDTSSSFGYECRLVGANRDKMLCAIRQNFNNASMDEQNRLYQKIVVYFGMSKMK